MISNAAVASHLAELARLATLEEGSSNAFRVRAYETAARTVELLDTPVAEMSAKDLAGLRGVGPSTAAKIRELVDTGRMARLEELRVKFPAPFVELTRIPGVGPKTAVMLRDELHINNVADLKAALDAQVLAGPARDGGQDRGEHPHRRGEARHRRQGAPYPDPGRS